MRLCAFCREDNPDTVQDFCSKTCADKGHGVVAVQATIALHRYIIELRGDGNSDYDAVRYLYSVVDDVVNDVFENDDE